MHFTVDIDGLDALEREAAAAERTLERDLARASFSAAEAGVEQSRATHRYQDDTYQLTNTAGAVSVDDEADMTWPMPYAGYVDATRFNFTNVATRRAEAVLQKETEAAAKTFTRTLKA
jgi:hypothetical protein